MDLLQAPSPQTSAEDKDPLTTAYRAHSADERRILQALSVVCQPIGQTQLQRVLDAIAWTDEKGAPLARRMGKPLRERFLAEGLILHEQNLLRCHPDILELPAREAVAEGTFGAIAAAAQRVVPPVSSYWSRREAPVALRQLRLALYGGQIQEVLRQLKVDGPFQPGRYDQVLPLIQVFTRPWDPAWIDRQDDALKFQFLAPLLTEAALRLDDQGAAYRLMEGCFPVMAARHPEVAYALAEQRLFRGRLEGVEELLGADDSDRALTLRGWLSFLRGAYAESRGCFDAALKTAQRRTRKRNSYIKGLPGVCHVLALMQGGRRVDLDAARNQVLNCAKATQNEPFEPTLRLLGDTVAVLQGELRTDESVWLQREPLTVDPYLDLIRCLALHWLGERPRARQAAKLPRFCQAAQAGGYLWYARESALLLDRLGKDGECADVARAGEGSPQVQPITDLIKPRQAWELALEALREVPGEAGAPAAAPDQSDLRMAWQLSFVDGLCTLDPREQRRNRHGGWSQGRAVSLQRLHEKGQDFGYLTPQDRRICGHIVPEMVYTHFGRYAKTAYRLDRNPALLAAVGHPLVFRAGDPDTAVDLVRAVPVLEVLREQGRLRLRIEPTPEPGATLVHQLEANGRVRLIAFDPGHRRIADILGPDGLSVPLEAKEQVLESIAAIAPLLSVHSDIGGGGEALAVSADARPHVQIQPAGAGGLRLELYVQPFEGGGPLFRPGQGGATVFAEVAGQQVRTTRDPAAERQAAETLLAHCPTLDREADWAWVLEDTEGALETLSQLQGLGDSVVLEWPQGRKIRLAAESGLGQMRVSVRQQRDWLGLDGELRLDDGRVLSMKQLLELIGESPGRFVRLGEDEFLSLTRELRKRLDAIRSFSDAGRFHPLAAAAIDEAIGGMEVTAGRPWQELLARIAQARELQPQIPSTLQAELRDYQAEGFRWLARLAHWGAGACLADDMGLGKTVQALTLILARAHQGPTLVLAPTSVCVNWLEETSRFAPTLRPIRFGPGDRARTIEDAGPFDLVVCSYGLLQSEAQRLSARHWHTIVADEAQAIKNALTKRSRAAMALSGEFRLITTGTPVENRLGELWNLFRFINPGLLGSLERFNQRFATPIEERQDQDARQRLKQLIRPFVLRRLKSDVLSELPPRTEIRLHVELGEEEAALYEALRRQAMERMAEPEAHPGQHRIRLLAEIMRLRRACCHPRLAMPGSRIGSSKLQAFADILDELLDNRHKALVFSQFVDHLSLIREYLDGRGIRYQYLDGATPTARRKAAVDAFQAGEGELFLISLRAGGVGLNLTAADYVIHMDPWWNPAVEDQASDRAHRIGQQRPVTVYRLVAKGTIEEKIVDLHRHKRDLADSLLEGTDAGGRLSVEEMLELIRGA